MTHTLAHRPTRRGVILQPRDLELLRLLVGEFIVLTRRQIWEIFPGRSVRRTNFRLSQLAQAGYVSRRYAAWLLTSRIPLYYLGPKAAVALDRDPEDATVASRRKQALQLRDGALPHLLLVNSVHIKFLTASRNYSDYELLAWIPQYAPVWQNLNRYGFALRPDGYAECRKDAFTFRFFLELDRGTERGRELREKLKAYEAYAQSGRFELHFSAPSFRVLFITTGATRVRSLLRAMNPRPPGLFWVTAADWFFSNPLFESHWRCPGLDMVYSLDAPL